jgi:hypothetical protein
MTLTIILNAILALGVSVVVITPLVWAILTQRRDHPRPTLAKPAPAQPPHRPTGPRAPRARPKAAAGRA